MTKINPHRRFHLRQKFQDILNDGRFSLDLKPIASDGHVDSILSSTMNQSSDQLQSMMLSSKQNENARVIADLNQNIQRMSEYLEQCSHHSKTEGSNISIDYSLSSLGSVSSHEAAASINPAVPSFVSRETTGQISTINSSSSISLDDQSSSYTRNVVRYVSHQEYVPVATAHRKPTSGRRKSVVLNRHDSSHPRTRKLSNSSRKDSSVASTVREGSIDDAMTEDSAILKTLFDEVSAIYSQARFISKELDHKKEISKQIEHINQNYIQLFERMLSETKRIYRHKLDLHQHELLESRKTNITLKDQIQGNLVYSSHC